jgi:hypothetical protein
MSQLTQQVPSERLNVLGPIPARKAPLTPSCPNCARPMALSHKFYAHIGGPKLWHFHCTICKVGLTEAEKDQELQ